MNKQDIWSIREELLSLCTDAEELPDPWIKLLCIYNLCILRDDDTLAIHGLINNYPGDTNIYGLILKNPGVSNFMLGISPHWRY